ncbi:hypothetical protein GF351_06300 [Candidatus Woesearchaeota archaeon]|nr:hypothetical protein [Candidatus Woesearchaeota archaeon]
MRLLGCVVAIMLVLFMFGCGQPAIEPEPDTTPEPEPSVPDTEPAPTPEPETDGEETETEEEGEEGPAALEGDIELKRFYTDEGQIESISPAEVTISSGTEITWVNTDDRPHVLTAIGGDVQIPGMKSLRLAPGESWSFTFEEVGTYTYIDVVFGSKGTIVVE